MPTWLRRIVAVVLQGAAGAGLAAGTLALVSELLDVSAAEVVLVAAAVGLLNGVLAGLLSIYAWDSPVGWVSFLLDHTWGLIGTAIAMLLHVVNLFWLGGRKYADSLSRHKNRYVYDGGFGFAHYAFTQGLVTSNLNSSRGDLVDHETLHIWQSRLFGPIFQATYITWFVVGALIGSCVSLFVKQSWFQTVTDMAYLDNPWETWAYKVGGSPTAGRFSWV